MIYRLYLLSFKDNGILFLLILILKFEKERSFRIPKILILRFLIPVQIL